MLTFYGDPERKAERIRRCIAHQEADRLLVGTYKEINGGFHACAIGCQMYDIDPDFNEDDNLHAAVAKDYGWPEWLCYLEDTIFEGLPKKDRKQWPVRLVKAVPVGVDIDPVLHQLAIRRLTRLADAQEPAIGDKWGVVAAIRVVVEYHRSPTESARLAALSAAESAAWSAAWSARSPARSAAWSAARSAAGSAAESVAWSARSAAARSARSAWSAAWSAAFRQEANDLIELLEGFNYDSVATEN